MRILVIGLDGACMDLIKQWAQEGKLPTFERLMREGSYGNFESVTPPVTIPAWNCLATGKNPGKIGHFSFLQKAPGSYNFRIHLPLVKKEKDVWDILSDYGKKVFVFNAPNVLSAYKTNGYMVAGFLCTSEERLTYPRSLRYEINCEMSSGDLTFLIIDDYERSRILREMTEKHCRQIFRLVEKDWNFGFVVLTELDGAQHRLWDKKDILIKHYQNIDRKLNELLNKLDEYNDETVVIIVSDHGFGANERMFLINEWLAKRGFLEVKKKPSFVLINALIRVIKGPNILKILRLLIKFPSLIPLYRRLFPHAVSTPVIWNKTKAFSYGNWGTIYINLEGREPQGTVKEENYERLRTEIIEGLKQVSVKAYRREEIYHGEYLEFAPDIIIQIDDYVSSVSGKVGYNKEFMQGFPQDGYHNKSNGTFIAWGPGIIKENFKMNARLYDLAPTVLHLFGVPIPGDMDGRVLKEIFREDLAMRGMKYRGLEEKRKVEVRIRELRNKGKI